MQAAVTASRRSVKAQTMTVMSSTPPSPAEPLSLEFSIAQRATLAAVAPSSAQRNRVAASLQPYAPTAAGDGKPDVLVAFDRALRGEVREQLGDTGDGLHTSWDGRGLRVVHEGAGCRLLFDGAQAAALVELEAGFAWWRAWTAVVRPLLSIPIAANGAVVTHAAAVTHEGRGIAIAGWSESGKTEVALALCERGAQFVSDKWTALADDGSLHAMPVPAGLRAWTVPHLPQLRRSLSAGQRARAGAGRAATNAIERVAGRSGGQAVTAAFSAARGAAALASRVSLSPTALGGGVEAPLRAKLDLLVVLRATSGQPRAHELDIETACRRLLTTTAYERRALDALDARSRYCGAGAVPGHGGLAAREQDIMRRVLAGCRVIELAAPFPADPRPAADAVLRQLRRA